MNELEKKFLSIIDEKKQITENGKKKQQELKDKEYEFLESILQSLQFLASYGFTLKISRGLERIQLDWKDGTSTRSGILRLADKSKQHVGNTVVYERWCDMKHLVFEWGGKVFPCGIDDVLEFCSDKAVMPEPKVAKVRKPRRAA